MSDVGICGNTIGPFATTSTALVCDLPAGHDGWHSCDNPPDEAPMGRPWLTSTVSRCHWTERLDLTWEDQLAAAERRGYDRAVANLRDGDRRRAWLRATADRWGGYDADAYADYLEATKETDR